MAAAEAGLAGIMLPPGDESRIDALDLDPRASGVTLVPGLEEPLPEARSAAAASLSGVLVLNALPVLPNSPLPGGVLAVVAGAAAGVPVLVGNLDLLSGYAALSNCMYLLGFAGAFCWLICCMPVKAVSWSLGLLCETSSWLLASAAACLLSLFEGDLLGEVSNALLAQGRLTLSGIVVILLDRKSRLQARQEASMSINLWRQDMRSTQVTVRRQR